MEFPLPSGNYVSQRWASTKCRIQRDPALPFMGTEFRVNFLPPPPPFCRPRRGLGNSVFSGGEKNGFAWYFQEFLERPVLCLVGELLMFGSLDKLRVRSLLLLPAVLSSL